MQTGYLKVHQLWPAICYSGTANTAGGITVQVGNEFAFGPSSRTVTLKGGRIAVESAVTLGNNLVLTNGDEVAVSDVLIEAVPMYNTGDNPAHPPGVGIAASHCPDPALKRACE